MCPKRRPFLSDDDRTPLAILAASGLERIEVNGSVWELGVTEDKGGTLEATALSASENRIWHLFATQFRPSREAVAAFLEHRRIQPTDDERDRVYAEAAKARRILGVLPLANGSRLRMLLAVRAEPCWVTSGRRTGFS